MHFQLGEDFGKLILKIAQENIMKGDMERAISIYTESFPGMTEEQALKIIKNQYVIIPQPDGNVTMTDDEKEIEANKENLFDWKSMLEYQFKELNQITQSITDRFNMLENADDFPYMGFQTFMHMDFDNLLIRKVNYTEAVLDIIKGRHSDEFDKLYDYCVDENTDECKLYHAISYVKDIYELEHKVFKIVKLYEWLCKNELCEHIRFAENSLEKAFYRLVQFIENNHFKFIGDWVLNNYKMHISHKFSQSKYGQEYAFHRCLKKEIRDGYDAGWLAPNGDFYGDNGDTSALIHMELAEKIFKFEKFPIKKANNDDYTLELNGWMKIHHDEVYGVFKYDKQDEGRALFCPTDIQVKAIADYIDTYHSGTFHNQAYICGGKDVKTSRLKQADEFQLHAIFAEW